MMSRLDQAQRLHTFKRFKNFKSRILVCTDLMARGVDSENVNLVINLDVPINSTIYLHRIGRAGRFGTHGMSVTLMTDAVELQKMRVLLTSLGGSKTYLTKFPMDMVPNSEVEMWDYETIDVREKYFGVDEIALQLVEQESLRTIRRKERLEKKRDNKKRGDVTTEKEETVSVPGVMIADVLCDVSNEKTPATLCNNNITTACSKSSTDDVDFDDLMSQLSSQLVEDISNAKDTFSVIEENVKLLAAAKCMVDGNTKDVGLVLDLPADLFGSSSFGITFAQEDVTQNVSIKVPLSADAEIAQATETISDLTTSQDDASFDFLNQDEIATEEPKAVLVEDVVPCIPDLTRSDDISFDNLLSVLDEPTKKSEDEAIVLLVDNLETKLLDKLCNNENTEMALDDQLFDSQEMYSNKSLSINTPEFVPSSHCLPQLPTPNSAAIDGQKVKFILHDKVPEVPVLSPNKSENNKVDAVVAKLNTNPFLQPSSIQSCPWIRVEPTPLASDVYEVDIEKKNEITETVVEKEKREEDDEQSEDNDEEEEPYPAASNRAAVQYFAAALEPHRKTITNKSTSSAQILWKAVYERQLSHIQDYVQFTKAFNRYP